MQENVPVEEVFQHLKCTKEGLTSKEVQERLTLFGYNKLEEKKVYNNLSLFLSVMLMAHFLWLCRRVRYSSSWGSCGIHFHGSWKLQPSWLLVLHMEEYVFSSLSSFMFFKILMKLICLTCSGEATGLS